jgi:hypothetical protein
MREMILAKEVYVGSEVESRKLTAGACPVTTMTLRLDPISSYLINDYFLGNIFPTHRPHFQPFPIKVQINLV